jgi:hypothetical protein
VVRPKRPIEELAERAKAQAEADVVLDATDRAIIEFFSDPKNRIRPRRRYNYDPERQEFVQDPIDFMVEALLDEIINGKPRRPRKPRRIRLPND